MERLHLFQVDTPDTFLMTQSLITLIRIVEGAANTVHCDAHLQPKQRFLFTPALVVVYDIL